MADGGELEASLVKRRVSEADFVWFKVAAISGMLAVALGAYGTHMFKPTNPTNKDVWQTASLYHLVHTVALLAAPLTKRPRVFGGLLTFGLLAFSGSCYVAALYENRSLSLPAPFGGFGFIGAWVQLLRVFSGVVAAILGAQWRLFFGTKLLPSVVPIDQGIAAIGAGTYGAHGFKPADPVYKTVWQTANLYHLVHTSALLAAPLIKRPNLFGSLLTFGIVAFSGTCYFVALNEDRKLSKPAPLGGLAFIAAWASLLF